MRRGDTRPTVCLNMIVKNEAHVIERCLERTKPLIDTWCIVDTGSTDGTQEIIRRTMADVPGTLHERPWKNFGHNRSEAIALAEGTADYILTIDADEIIERKPDFAWQGLAGDALMIFKRRGTRRYRVMNLVRSGLGWRWVGAVHEHPEADRFEQAVPYDGIEIVSPREGARSLDPNVFRRDALMLEAALLEDPTDTRNVFYLAQSYRDADDLGLALRWYRKRVEMGGWHEEVFISLYQIARLKLLHGDPWPECLEAYLTAHQHTPHRAEPLYEIGMAYAHRGWWACAWTFLERAARMERDESLLLFVEEEVYEWRARLEAAVAAYWTGEHEAAIGLNRALLAGDTLPDRLRGQVEQNIRHSEEALGAERVRRSG